MHTLDLPSLTPYIIAWETAADLLNQGDIVAIPSETVYGLAGNAYDDQSITRIYELKGRPATNPLIVHYANISAIEKDAVLSAVALKLAEKFWPGPLTLVMQRKTHSLLSTLVSAGHTTVAVRIPAHPVFQSVLSAVNFPLAAPSANRSNHISPTRPQHIIASFLHSGISVPPIVAGDPCTLGLESTVIDVSNGIPRILRLGSIPVAKVEEILGMPLEAPPSYIQKGSPALSPGLHARHYAPRKPLRTNASTISPEEGLITFGPVPSWANNTLWRYDLSLQGCLDEAAARLFEALYILEATPCQRIAVMPLPYEGIGLSMQDRLTRASTPEKHIA